MTDGTSRRLTYFDELAKDDGYAAAIETDPPVHGVFSSNQTFFSRRSPGRGFFCFVGF